MAFEEEARDEAAKSISVGPVATSPPPEFLRLVIDHLSDGILVSDAGGRIMYVNDSAARTCGHPSAQALVGSPLGDALQRFEIWDEAGVPVTGANLPIERSHTSCLPCEAMLRFRTRGSRDARRTLRRRARLDGARRHVVL
jgi:PAS domain-containing protein